MAIGSFRSGRSGELRMDHSVDVLNAGAEVREPPTPPVLTNLSITAEAPFLLSETSADPAVLATQAAPAVDHDTRALDIAIASLLLILVAPLMAVCALAIFLSGPGPLIFRQARIGRNGKEFLCLKFRTMVCDADAAIEKLLQKDATALEQWRTVQKLYPDPRVTQVGRFMRRYCLDELPQLFNVLAGDMSMVGPRPIVANEIEKYGPNFADYCSVRPGLTGLWQISGRHALPYEERVRLDTNYARTKSSRGDLLILWRTVPIVLVGDNV